MLKAGQKDAGKLRCRALVNLSEAACRSTSPAVLLSSCTVVLLLYALSFCTFFHPQVHPAQAGLRLSACGICCRPRKKLGEESG